MIPAAELAQRDIVFVRQTAKITRFKPCNLPQSELSQLFAACSRTTMIVKHKQFEAYIV